MLLFGNKLELLNTIIIIIIIVFLLFCFITNYFKSIEQFSQYGYVACPPQFTKVGDTNNMYYNSGNVGINNDNPTANLHVTGYSLTEGVLGVSGGTLYAKDNNHLQAGSLVIGSTSKNYGGGNNWNSNTAGLMLECADNTEIAVHDSGHRLASLMYYQGAGHNTIHIGRNMNPWGVTKTQMHGELQIKGAHRMSHICHSSGNTYIRGGNNGGQVLLNDSGGGRVYCGEDLYVGRNFRIRGNVIQLSQDSYHNTHIGLGASKWHHAVDYATLTTGYDDGNKIETMWMQIKNGSSYIKMYYNNRIIASTWVCDERVKTNIVKVNDNMQYMNYLRKCNMYKYNFKEKLEKCPEDIPDDGLIAQELEKIIPKSVDKAVGTIKDIDTKCTIVNDILELDINGKINYDIKENDVLELTDECLQHVKLKIKSIIDNNKYSIELCENEKIDYNKKYNVTGYVVDDLRHLDYNLLNRISIGAIKYLDNEVTKLKEIIEKQQDQIEKQQEQIELLIKSIKNKYI